MLSKSSFWNVTLRGNEKLETFVVLKVSPAMPRIERIPCGLIVVVWVSNSHSPAFPFAWEPSADLIYTPVSLQKRTWDQLGSLWVVVDKGMCLQKCWVRVLGGNWVLGQFVRSGFLQVLGGNLVTFCKRICTFSWAGWHLSSGNRAVKRNSLKWRGFLSSLPSLGRRDSKGTFCLWLLGISLLTCASHSCCPMGTSVLCLKLYYDLLWLKLVISASS